MEGDQHQQAHLEPSVEDLGQAEEGSWFGLGDAGMLVAMGSLAALVLLALISYTRKGSAARTQPAYATPAITTATPRTNNGKPAVPALNKATKQNEEEDPNAPPVKFLWGSQTGTAEDFASTLADEARKYKFRSSTHDLEEYDPEELAEEKFVVFVVATYGEGEPTDNAKDFYEWLMSEDREKGSLEGLKYTVFGLGNRTYEHYNAVARTFDSRLEALGATRVYARGEGDDDSSLEEDFAKWRRGLWPVVCPLNGLSYDGAAPAAKLEPVAPRTQLVEIDHDSEEGQATLARLEKLGHAIGTTVTSSTQVVDQKNPVICQVIVNKELHSSTSDRSCRHVEIAIPDIVTYEPGDHVGIFPHNDEELVEQLAARLNATDMLDKLIALQSISSGSTTPRAGRGSYVMGPVTLRHALRELVDLTNPPRKSFLGALVQYAEDPTHKQRLELLSSEDQSALPPHEQYQKWVKEDRRTVGEILTEFSSVKVPLGHLLELLPALAPRYYSISSSPLEHAGHIHVTSVVVNYNTGTGRHHRGVCSNFLASQPVGSTVPLFVRRSTFRLPREPETPLIMVGPGTGVAPFRGFIHQRKHMTKSASSPALLFFGCRDRTKDFIYEDELKAAQEQGHLSNLMLAFSREQEHKVYVQDKIREHKQEVWDLLHNRGAHFYICGDAAQMAPAVRAALVDIVMELGSKTRDEAEAFITDIQEQGRYSTDVWF